jgi:hypothetical protein
MRSCNDIEIPWKSRDSERRSAAAAQEPYNSSGVDIDLESAGNDSPHLTFLSRHVEQPFDRPPLLTMSDHGCTCVTRTWRHNSACSGGMALRQKRSRFCVAVSRPPGEKPSRIDLLRKVQDEDAELRRSHRPCSGGSELKSTPPVGWLGVQDAPQCPGEHTTRADFFAVLLSTGILKMDICHKSLGSAATHGCAFVA